MPVPIYPIGKRLPPISMPVGKENTPRSVPLRHLPAGNQAQLSSLSPHHNTTRDQKEDQQVPELPLQLSIHTYIQFSSYLYFVV